MASENLLAPFALQARQHPNRIAINVDEQEYSYVRLYKEICRIAGWLATQNLPENSRIGIYSQRTFSGYAAIYATIWAGLTYVPLNPKFPIERVKKIVERSDLSAIIFDTLDGPLSEQLSLPLQNIKLLSLNGPSVQSGKISWDGADSLAGIEPLNLPVNPDASAGAYLMFTSGTTGVPKGILATVANLKHYLDFMQRRYAINAEDRLSQLFELSFDASAFDLFMSVNHGATFYTVPENQLIAPAQFIKQHRLTIWFGVPSNIAFMQKMRLLPPGCFPDIRVSIFGGEPLTHGAMTTWLAATPNTVMDNVYGPTEATVTCFVQRCNAATPVTEGRDVMSIGQPYDDMLGAIVDEQGTFLPVNEKGELVIAGPQVTPGYWQDDPLTEIRFRCLKHPQYGEQRWYFTGDLALLDEQNIFHHFGRLDNQVKVSGHRVELEEIDALLRKAADTDAVAAVPWPMQAGSARGIVAFVCNSSKEDAEIRAFMQQNLPAYMVPRQIIKTDALPYTLNGKVDRNTLIQQLNNK